MIRSTAFASSMGLLDSITLSLIILINTINGEFEFAR